MPEPPPIGVGGGAGVKLGVAIGVWVGMNVGDGEMEMVGALQADKAMINTVRVKVTTSFGCFFIMSCAPLVLALVCWDVCDVHSQRKTLHVT